MDNIPAISYTVPQSRSGSFGDVYRVKLKECLEVGTSLLQFIVLNFSPEE